MKFLVSLMFLFAFVELNAQSGYVKFVNPSIPGGVVGPNFLVNTFPIEGFNFGIKSQNGKANPVLLSFNLEESIQSPKLLENLLNPSVPMDLEVIFTLNRNDTEIRFLHLKCEKSFINAIRFSSDPAVAGNLQIEIWVNEYAIRYEERNLAGNVIAFHDVGWNFLLNRARNF